MKSTIFTIKCDITWEEVKEKYNALHDNDGGVIFPIKNTPMGAIYPSIDCNYFVVSENEIYISKKGIKQLRIAKLNKLEI